MPIEVATDIRRFEQVEFHLVDEKLMRIVFDVHNEFGRFFDEALYKKEIAARWTINGLGSAEPEVRITVSHDTFRKDYLIDLLFNHGVVLEAKAAERIAPAHRSQSLHYLFLTGLQHGRLVNLRPASVEYEFFSTKLTLEKRRQFSLVESNWLAANPESAWLREKLLALLNDWGTHLELALYRDAITHFLGGSEAVVRPVNVFSSKRFLGEQSVHLLTEDTAFAFTAINEGQSSMKEHQQRFLKHTPLRYIQWINLNHHKIELATLTNEK